MSEKNNEQKIFGDFMKTYVSFFDEMVEVQKEQLAAVTSKEIGRVEKSVLNLQVYLKKLNSFEQKRVAAQKSAGYGEMTFSQIVEAAPQEDKQKFSLLFEELQKKVSDIAFYNSKSQEIVKTDLVMKGLNDDTASFYNAQKKPVERNLGNFSTKA